MFSEEKFVTQSITKTQKRKARLWFVGLYCASLLSLGAFHYVERLLIAYLKA